MNNSPKRERGRGGRGGDGGEKVGVRNRETVAGERKTVKARGDRRHGKRNDSEE